MAKPNLIPPIGNRDSQVRALLAELSKNRRHELAALLGACVERTVTKCMLDEYTRNPSEGREMRFPLAWTAAFCSIAGNDRLSLLALSQRQRDLLALGEFVWGLLDEETRRLLARRGRKPRGRKA